VNVLWFVLALLGATTVHEAGHVAMVKVANGDVTEFRPYPNNGHFGTYAYRGTDRYRAGICLAGPLASEASLPFLYYAERKTDAPLFRYWASMAELDLLAHSVASLIDRGNDIGEFCDETGVPRAAMVVLAGLSLRYHKHLYFDGRRVGWRWEI